MICIKIWLIKWEKNNIKQNIPHGEKSSKIQSKIMYIIMYIIFNNNLTEWMLSL